MGVLLVLVLILVLVVGIGRAKGRGGGTSYQDYKQPETLKTPEYDTILHIQPELTNGGYSARTIYCKDGIIYRENGIKIGTYKKCENGRYEVIGDQMYEIGYCWENSDLIYLSLYGRHMSAPHLYPRRDNWLAAEKCQSAKSIIDHDTYAPIGLFEGNSLDAAAGFICWAYDGYKNKYSDFFSIK